MLEENYVAKNMVGETAADVVEAFHKTGIARILDVSSMVYYHVGTKLTIMPTASLGVYCVSTLKTLGFTWIKTLQQSTWFMQIDIHDHGIVQPRKRVLRVELDRACAEEIFEMLYEGESERQREGA